MVLRKTEGWHEKQETRIKKRAKLNLALPTAPHRILFIIVAALSFRLLEIVVPQLDCLVLTQ